MRSVAHVLVTGSLIATELSPRGDGAQSPLKAQSLYSDPKILAEKQRWVACFSPSSQPLTTGGAEIRNPGSFERRSQRR